MKVVEKIPFAEIPSIPRLIKDFLKSGVAGAEPFLFSLENFRDAVRGKKDSFSSQSRTVLVEELRRQLSGSALTDIQKKHLDDLGKDNCFTVTTGHQLNFFSGPAFFVYKILQVIKTASYLKKNFPENNFVPVFWMATEDHDFEEISHFKTAGGYYEMFGKAGGAVGRITPETKTSAAAFEAEFKDSIFGTELALMMKDCYREGATLAEATRKLVHHLFSEFGVITVDGDSRALKLQMEDVFKDEILHSELLGSTKNTVAFLKENYGKVQVNPREINLFYLSETRNRIDRKGEGFVAAETRYSFSEEEIITELRNCPEKFSPNALMRPVYQETVLPNVAYIGGNAEVMYWLELPEYFRKINLPFPVLVPRESMLFLPEKTLRKSRKYQVGMSDFLLPFADVLKNKILCESDITGRLDALEAVLADNFAKLKTAAEGTEKSFRNLVEAEETRQLKSFERMRKRLLRAEKIKYSEKADGLRNLYLDVNPGGSWQERVLNFSVFYADHGAAWLRFCLAEMDVEKSELIISEI